MEPVNNKQIILQLVVLLAAAMLLARLYAMQIVDTTYKTLAKDNVVREITIYPSRGLIFDRKGNLIVNNLAVYDLMVIPRQVENLDTTKFCALLSITQEEFNRNAERMKNAAGYTIYKPQVFIKQVPAHIYDRMQEYLYQFQGFYTQIRTVRQYNCNNAAHILGYIGEVNQKQIDTSNFYRMGDYVGISGVEKSYEEELRGERGIRYVIVDVHNREVGRYKDGEEDIEASAGQDLRLTIDMELQAFAESIMQNKRGSIVAIEPETGEILALVTAPSYNPNLLTGPNRAAGMRMLLADSLKPMFNRALMAYYPPGSTFKPLMGLVAMQETGIGANYYYGCNGAYRLGRRTVGCHYHASCFNIQAAIQHSCNAYFCHLFKLFVENYKFNNVSQGLYKWKEYLMEFGLGRTDYLDLPALTGFVPDGNKYDKMYGKNRWKAVSIISLGIGQGELGVTPLQMAHSTAVIANKGTFVYPHVVRPNPQNPNSKYNKKHKVSINPKHFNAIIEGMEQVVLYGTGKSAYMPGLNICGKTGTAQNPHGEDHSLFIAFAPKDNPKIAVAVMVENGGQGKKYAAPIASLVIEKYLNDSIAPYRKYLLERMTNANLLSQRPKTISYASNGEDDDDDNIMTTILMPYTTPTTPTLTVPEPLSTKTTEQISVQPGNTPSAPLPIQIKTPSPPPALKPQPINPPPDNN
ncbi:MAG TPA: penicillin-binding protein 2 [Chitinophagales bacterium]|nr:penicillin-binding protein 2 [Chitinophagales bacterium]HRK28465.1 penicillin-binding protein 2 [Chitinophagales bacterium]